ncbi:MAG: pyridoxal-phosphate dependent enzyme, partial [Candidatus Marinimicrobia bacterium]|nr:pyridoxal-phosphate dependent enzyme [Candidatus Neomarinimicrobiota bacterium]
GMTVLECSTGNAGIACSFLAAVKGYKCIIVMPVGMSEERKKLDIAYGSEMVYTPGGESDVDLALDKLEELRSADPDKYWVPAQFENSDNISAHEATTGPEIWEQMEGVIDIFVASQGTGGTLTGVGKYLKSVGSNAQLYAVEPSECPLLSKREWGEHKIEGIGDGFVPKNLHLELLSGIVTTTSDESLEMARRLAREEGLLCGISSGCNVVAALKLAKKFPEAKRIVTMLNDTGQRYFSTELMGEAKEVEIPDREHPMNDYTKQELDKYQSAWTIVN